MQYRYSLGVQICIWVEEIVAGVGVGDGRALRGSARETGRQQYTLLTQSTR